MHGVALIKKDIAALVKDFYKVTGIRIAFISHDQSLWIEFPKEKTLFCSILRNNPKFEEQCRICDKNAFNISRSSEALYIYKCHAGLTEAVSPIINEGKLLGYLMLGQALDRNPDTELWKQMSFKYNIYGMDPAELEQAFYQLKSFNADVINSAARIMDISAKYIHISKMAKLKEPQLVEKIRLFIEKNSRRNISVGDISNYLNLSVSHVSHIIKANFNSSFTEYLLHRRLLKAKQLLEQSDLKVKDISHQVGFPEQNYFARVFKKNIGVSPTEYRNHNIK